MTRSPTLGAACWNAWSGQRAEAVRSNLARLVEDLDYPEVLAGQELKHYRGGIEDYRRLDALDRFRHEDAGNCVLFVRRDVRIVRRRIVPVGGPDWLVVSHRKWHPPRIYVGATLAHDGRLWDALSLHRVTNGHTVNADAYAAEDRRLKMWASRRPNRPTVLLGDWNSRPADPRRRGVADLAHRLDGELAVRGIDGGIVLNAEAHRLRKLEGRYGSDHHRPVRMTLTTGVRP